MQQHSLKFSLSLLIAVIASSSFSFAQEALLKGVVFDENNGETIPLVNIVKTGTTIGTSSNDLGAYQLSLSPGEHSIRFSSIGYKDTLITFFLDPDEVLTIDVYLREDHLFLDEIVVSADRVTRIVQELAVFRDRQNKGLVSYEADIYKLAILGTTEEYDTLRLNLSPMAFSERVSKIRHIMNPERFSETTIANRNSKNFFSEYDFFSTGGPPLNLNQELVPISILSEDITVIGPISKRAGRFYYLSEEEAGDGWPEGTSKIIVNPKVSNRPLFIGSIWYNQGSSTILGIDVTLNDYASTNSGLFSIYDLRYEQTYQQFDEFWLPEQTKLSAKLEFIGASRPITYKDEWTWDNHRINPRNLNPEDLDLNTSVVQPDAHKRKKVFWDSLSVRDENENFIYLDKAQEYNENNRSLRLGMSIMSRFFRLPYQLERFYLTNISDIYHYNRVEGHTFGLGLRTPVHPNYDFRVAGNYGVSSEEFTYRLQGLYFIPRTAFAPDVVYQNDIIQQYQDYEYNRTPLDFFEFRHTMAALFAGDPENNYFRRTGLSAGVRYRFDIESFLRIQYLNEEHTSLETNTNYNVFGNELDVNLAPNNHPVYPAIDGRLKGVSVHLHHDTRKYLRTQFLRDYNIRDFGWLVDAKLESGISEWGSDFGYNRYRIGLKFNVPVFSSHFIQSDLIIGASDSGTPGQRMFSYNGFVMDDYVRERPFNTVSFKEPVGYRVSLLKVKYKFGSSITRKAPIGFIQKSGIHLATFLTYGILDETPGLQPLLPTTNAETQAEIGIAAFKIFGFIYVEFSRRLIGDFGNSVGLQVLF